MGRHVRRQSPPRPVAACAGPSRTATRVGRTAAAAAGPRRPAHAATTVVGAYVALTKPRIIELLLDHDGADDGARRAGLAVDSADASSRWSAARSPPAAPTPSTCTSTATSTRLMERTQDRPLVTGVIAPRQRARLRASRSRSLAFAVLWAGANLLSAVLALVGHRLLRLRVHAVAEAHEPPEHRHRRRRRRRAGARRLGRGAPTRSAGRRSCCSPSMFFWTPPHFWALAIRYADDYRAADVPMLPAVVPLGEAARQMIVLHGRARRRRRCCSIPVADLGWIYTVAAVVLGAGVPRRHDRARPAARRRPRSMRVFALQHHATSRCCSAR